MKLWEGREKLERLRGKIGTFSARDESFGREKILTREDGETMVTAKLLTLRRIKATSRLRGGTRNTRKPVASSAHEGCVVFANGSTLPILICVNTLDAFISEESIKAFLVLRNVFDVCHAYFRTKINAGRTISFFFFSSSFARQKFIISAFVQKKKASFLLTRYTLLKNSRRDEITRKIIFLLKIEISAERDRSNDAVLSWEKVASRFGYLLLWLGSARSRVEWPWRRFESRLSRHREKRLERYLGRRSASWLPVSARACVRSVDKLLEMELVFLSGERKLPSKGSDMDIAYSE